MLKYLLSRGGNPNLVSGTGYYPVHIAINPYSEEEAISQLEALVEHGADLHKRNPGGYTVLATSVLGARPRVVQWLLDHGADPVGDLDDGFTYDKIGQLVQGPVEDVDKETIRTALDAAKRARG